jgi:hypothetical protein
MSRNVSLVNGQTDRLALPYRVTTCNLSYRLNVLLCTTLHKQVKDELSK